MRFLALCFAFLSAASSGYTSQIFFQNSQGQLEGLEFSGIQTPAAAVEAMATPPQGWHSAIPAGTRVLDLSEKNGDVLIEFSPEILTGLNDATLEDIFYQVRATLRGFGYEKRIRMQCGGRLLSDHLPPTPIIEAHQAAPQAGAPGSFAPGMALVTRSVALSPGHGKVWTDPAYTFERPVYCDPLSCEDDHNNEIMAYLNQYLIQDGAVTKVYRCLDKNFGTHAGSGEPWWRLSAGYWLQLQGYPCTVYSSLSGDCTLGTGGTESSDSLRSRGLASNHDNTTIYVSLHSNGYTGDCSGLTCPNGTSTYYDASSTEHAAWGVVSSNLARRVNTSLINVIRNNYGDTTWRDRGIVDADGSQAETRIPNRAAILIELAFHDNCDRDAVYLRDNYFRSLTMWATYKGICDYFGVTPGWDVYSCEIVSDTIPHAMMPGSTATVQVVMRNRGVLWNDARGFKLGAVGDSDTFSATNRVWVGTEVGPGNTKSFTLTLKAPMTTGSYITDWRMVREGVTWFGPTLTKTIVVTNDTAFPTPPTNLIAEAVGPNQIDLSWSGAGDDLGISQYRIYRNSTLLATTNTTTYYDTACVSLTTYTYYVVAVDFASKASSPSPTATATTPPTTEFIIDNPSGVASGSWSTGTSAAGRYGSNYRFADTSASQTATFKWTPKIEQPGFYQLYTWYPEGSNRCTNSPFMIKYAGGGLVRPVNQTTSGGVWLSLGPTRPFITGTNGYIQLGNQTTQLGKVVLADAVRFVYSSALPAIPNITAQRSGTNVVLSWSNTYCMLQESTSLSNPVWVDLPAATSPYVVSSGSAQRKFYRLRY